MSLDCEIVIVSGLPRAGTSLMMQMLSAGGMDIVTDNLRTADVDNPRGYWELEQVKKIKRDASWLPQTRGRVFKMVSQLLYDLPSTERYRIIFMQRSLEEVIVSQEKMLQRRNRPAVPHDQMKRAFDLHLERLFQWLPNQSNIQLLEISYNALLRDPATHAQQISAFLDGRPVVGRMIEAVDLSLYRNRRPADT